MPAYPWNIPVHPWCVNSNLSNILLDDIDQPLCIKYISHWISINISPVHGKKVSELYLELCTWELKMSAPIQPCKVKWPITDDTNSIWPITVKGSYNAVSLWKYQHVYCRLRLFTPTTEIRSFFISECHFLSTKCCNC